MMCRFYGYTLEQVGKMTLDQFNKMFAHISDITSYELEGKLPTRSVTGPLAAKLASQLLSRKR